MRAPSVFKVDACIKIGKSVWGKPFAEIEYLESRIQDSELLAIRRKH